MKKLIRTFIYIIITTLLFISCTVGDFSDIEQYQDMTGPEITSFEITSPVTAFGVISGTNIDITVPFGTDVTALVPAIIHTGTDVNPPSGAPQDFTFPVTYIVTAEDNSTTDYTVNVTVASGSAKEITSFNIISPSATGVISGTNIDITVPFGTPVIALVPAITHTGASISPASGVPQDFSSTVVYTVTAADTSTQDYYVNVTVAPNTAKEITVFDIISPVTANGIISGLNINIDVPFGTDVTAMQTNILHTGISVTPPSGAIQDFTFPLVYTVTAEDSSIQNYTVTATVLPNPAATVVTTVIQGNPALAVDIAGTSALAEGNVTDEGGSPVTNRGICWNTTGSPTIMDTVMASGSGPGIYNANMSGLSENTVYYVRAYAQNLDGVAYGNEVVFNSGYQFSATIFQGGYVFYNDGYGGGIVASTADQGISQLWITGGSTEITLNGLTQTVLGSGAANTAAIIAQAGHIGSAAQLCDTYDDGTYFDWYLPSLAELDLMYEKLYLGGIGGLVNLDYWSSSESTATQAWSRNFGDGNQYENPKNASLHVRAVRSF